MTVYVPKRWIDLKGLKAGDEVDVAEENERIVIARVGETRQLRKEVTLETTTPSVMRSTIASLYKAGYDEMVLKFKETPPISSINEIISTFTGLEAVSQDKNSVTIKCFLRIDDEETEKLINKMFQLTKLVVEEVITGWNKLDVDNITALVKTNVLKLRDHLLRTINASKYGGDKSYYYYDLVTILEKIATEFQVLALNAKENKLKDKSLLMPLSNLLDEGYKCYLKKDMESAQAYKLVLREQAKKTLWHDVIASVIKKNDPVVFTSHYHIMKLYNHLSSRLISISS